MIVLDSVYQILIGPVELLMEVLFSIADRMMSNPALAVVFLSLAMGLLMLPLHWRADALQAAERNRSARMRPEIERIKEAFEGDERSERLKAYYRECGRTWVSALKGSASLLLEIALFIAACHFFSNLAVLGGESLGLIADLGAPDELIHIGSVSINLLPILATAIAAVAAVVYLKGFPLKDNVLTYGLAVVFLVPLYVAPACFALFWLICNVCLLAKNLFCKLKNPGWVLAVLASVIGVAAVAAAIVLSSLSAKFRIIMIVCALLLQVPVLVGALRRRGVSLPHIPEATKRDDYAFLLGSLFLSLLTGVLMPLAAIVASPAAFAAPMSAQSLPWDVVGAFLLALGTFFVWFGVIYRLASSRGRYLFGAVLLVICGVFLADCLLFGTGYSNLSALLQFGSEPMVASSDVLKNFAAIALVAFVLFAIWWKKRTVACVAYACMCVAAVVLCVVGAVQISAGLSDEGDASGASEDNAHFVLSADGKNVVVIMMDRAISAYVPFVMAEHPEIEAQFDGFVWYPDTLSYGSLTNVGSPGLYGGYEYIPENMNARSDVSLRDKQNEALRVMPVLFSEAGYDVTVLDPTYANYSTPPDLDIYSDYPDIKAYNTMDGSYPTDEFGLSVTTKISMTSRSRNFFCYGIFKVAPVFAQPVLYNEGYYNSAQILAVYGGAHIVEDEYTSPQTRDGWSKAEGVDQEFLRNYSVLQSLPEMTVVSDAAAGGFLMMSNDTPHDPTVLQQPECRPSQSVDNTEYDRAHDVRADAEGNTLDITKDSDDFSVSKHMHYEVNTAAWRELGNWFDYLRDQGVYDNTRIIIVSDHGRDMGLSDELLLDYQTEDGWDETRDMQIFNCTLMVKDFGATGFTRDGAFMTNADVPLLALEGVVAEPVNPSTGKPLVDDEKHASEHHVQWPDEWSTNANNGNVFLPGSWFCLTGDDVLDGAAWSYLGKY